MQKGDIVLIPFPFSDLSGNKLRPAVVLIFNENDITVSFITTQLKWHSSTDILLNPSNTNGIKKPSLIRLNKIATIDRSLALGKIGSLNQTEINDLNIKLRKLFDL